METKLIKIAYNKGFIDGITAYAHWKDGQQEVGTTGTPLKNAIQDIRLTWNYAPLNELTIKRLNKDPKLVNSLIDNPR